MGSSGSGNFSDYSSAMPKAPKQGGASNEEICVRAFSTKLEEVPRSEYFKKYSSLPRINDEILIVVRGRIAAIASTGELIGYLPTSFNYIAQCLAIGFTYVGTIQANSTNPIPNVTIDVIPKK